MNIPHGRGTLTRLPKGTKFAAISETVRQAIAELLPAAQHLYLKLANTHRPGWVFELDCKEWAGELGYTLRHMYRAVDQLQNSGLLVVEKVIGWGRRYFKGHWQYPAAVTQMSAQGHACPEKNLEPSSGVGSSTDLKINTHPPNPSAVESEDSSEPASTHAGMYTCKNVSEVIQARLRQLGVKLHKQVVKNLEAFSENSIEKAISVLSEASNVKNATGFFMQALRFGWEPSKPTTEQGFKTWFDAAYKAGLVVASELRPDGLYIAKRTATGHAWVKDSVTMRTELFSTL